MKRPYLLREQGKYILSWAKKEEIPEEALLFGGFSRESSEDGPPPSPTLLLNVSFFAPEELLPLAEAEKERLEENVFRSYVRDTREEPVAVISKDPEKLKRFLALYGGLFSAQPFCLTKDPAFPQVEEIGLERAEGKYRFSYLLWAPVEEERCTFCGICGRVCPEEAALPGPTIDPRRCDLCRECEKACPEGALDLSRYEEVTEDFLFVVFLDEIPEEVPRKEGYLFGPDELGEFFARLGSFEIHETVRFEEGRCQFVSRFGEGCRLCLTGCKALEIEESVSVDHFLCEDCGRCVGACPTGALDYAPFEERSFVAYLEKIPLSGCTVIVGREEDLLRLFWHPSFPKAGAFFFLVHEAPKALGLSHLFSFLAKGASRVVFLAEEPAVLDFANEIIAKLFGKTPFSSASLEDLPEVLSSEEPLFLEPQALTAFKGRRRYFAELLRKLWTQAGRPSFELERDDFGWLEIDSGKCTLCLACLNECRQEALAADEENFSLTFTPALCVACGVCEKTCPEGALKLKKGFFLREEFFESLVLAQDEPVFCRRCGKVFGTKKSQEKVRQTLSGLGRFGEMLPLLDYCEDCRVKEIFEKME
ncbi:MAG: hypothetical protein GXO20_01070 [Thermodesulfobacteria bacterium]|nr:hypothetical protein [Thermodesulfobacteriota bacterium]